MAFDKFFGNKTDETTPKTPDSTPVNKQVSVGTTEPDIKRPVNAPLRQPVAPVATMGNSPSKQDAVLIKNLKLFNSYNEYKASVIKDCMPKDKFDCYSVLSLLMHTNISGLPGYMENENMPIGIKRFKVSTEQLETAKKILPGALIKDDYLRSIREEDCKIESLLTIGSIGSTAQNSHSDFDFWLCINEDEFTSENLFLMKKKIKKIEEWADDKFDLEVHFFITDLKKAVRNEFGATDEESTGTAMAKLLKEEFLRSYFLVAGKTPYWSMVPAGVNEASYYAILDYVKKSAHITQDNYIDLGPTPSISMDEYFGAALWQINKALTSPYKSVFKMALLLAYVMDPKGGLVCENLKQRLEAKKPEDGWPDPYLIMFEKVLGFFQKRGDEKTVDLLRKCMYMKMEIKVQRSLYQSTKNDAKTTKVLNYIKEWQWDHEVVQDLNIFDEWGFKKNVGFGMNINNFLISAYRELSDMVKQKGEEIKISQNDLTVLGRKIYVIYSKHENKLNCISQFSDKDPHQDNLTLVRTSQHGQNEIFNVYMDDVTNRIAKKQDTKDFFLYSSKSGLGALSWIVLNKCYGPKTRLNIINYQLADDMTSLIEDMFSFFPPIDISKIDSKKLLHGAVKEKVYIVINISVPRWTKEVKTVGIVSRNSWGEMFLHEYTGADAINKAIAALQEGKFELLSEFKNFYKIYIPKGDCYAPLLNYVDSALKRQISFHFGNQSFYKHSNR